MKYVDEYRDPELARTLAHRIAERVEPGRHYKLMEVCGGHTHAIYRYGVQDYLPESIELVHGPGCPVCVIPMGRIDDATVIAEAHPEVILTCFGDLMRVPGGRGSFLDARARGADIRVVYSPLDALRIAVEHPDRHVVFYAIGFETTAPSTALTLQRAKADGVTNFSVFCNHVTIIPAIKAILDSPDLRLDAFIGPGHVSTVIGNRPYEWIAADEHMPIVVAGFEPLDLLEAIAMIVDQLADGRAEVENQYARVVRDDGNPVALRAIADTMTLRPVVRVARARVDQPLGAAGVRALRRLRRRAALRGARRAGRRSQGLPVRRGAEGRAQAVGVQGVRHRVHAGDADRHVHGLLRGGLRGGLQLRQRRPPARRAEGQGVTAEQRR